MGTWRTWAVIGLVCAACSNKSEPPGGTRHADHIMLEEPAAEAPAPAVQMDHDESARRAEALLLEGAQAASGGGALADVLAGGAVSGYDPMSAYGADLAYAAGVGVATAGKGSGGPKAELEAPAAVTRSWFPETFLFEPLVITDEEGRASLPVRVPDRLTSWRVLALAHSRGGAQGGAVTSFLGTLPVYVDPVLPKTLVVGDEISIPIQIVNTSAEKVSAQLAIEAENAALSGVPGARTLAPGASSVEYVKLAAKRPGQVLLRVALGSDDAVLRTIEVKPAGQRVSVVRSGTLAAPRTLRLDGTPGADPGTDRVQLRAYPGALALLRAELTSAPERTGPADNAYTLLLASRAAELLSWPGDPRAREALREMSVLAGQRAVRDGRTLDIARATWLTQAALHQSDNAVLTRLGQRAADFLARHQLPDGTFEGPDGRTVQHMLVATADVLRAVNALGESSEDQRRTTAMSARALGAFTRNLSYVEDGYTAAAILATGVLSGPELEALRTKVRASLKASEDGAKYLEVPEGVVRPDGARPSRVEATAMAALALPEEEKLLLADLGATLLGAYDAQRAWGDGRTNMLAMLAVLRLFKAPVPNDVRITLLMDGEPVLEGMLEQDKLHHVLTLDAPAPGLDKPHEWKVIADPPVPGLGYALTLESWVPWSKDASQGLELAMPEKVSAVVGEPMSVTLAVSAPANDALHIHHALPAGVQPETASLEKLVSSGAITKFTVMDGTVDLYAPSRTPGQLFSVTYRVVPTFAGTLRSAASRIEAGVHVQHVPPSTWIIRAAKQSARPPSLAAATSTP